MLFILHHRHALQSHARFSSTLFIKCLLQFGLFVCSSQKKICPNKQHWKEKSLLTGRNLEQDHAHLRETIAKKQGRDRHVSLKDIVPSWPVTEGLTYCISALLVMRSDVC